VPHCVAEEIERCHKLVIKLRNTIRVYGVIMIVLLIAVWGAILWKVW
jgi:hypothetical protein